MLASCSSELKFHNCFTGTLQSMYRSLYAPDQSIENLSWSFDDTHIVILPKNGNAEILNARNSCFATVIPVLQTSAATFQRTKNNVAVGTATGKLILYNVDNGNLIPSDHEILTPVSHLDFNAADTQMALGGGGSGKIVLLSKFKLSSCLLMPSGAGLTAMRFHKEFNQLAAGGQDGIVNIWDTQAGASVFSSYAHTSDVTDLTFVPVLSMVISVSRDYSCVMHDLRNDHATIFSFTLPCAPASVDFAPSKGYNFALSTEIGGICMYDLRKMGTAVFHCREHGSRVNCVRFPSQAVQSMNEQERLIVADGDKARSVVELYKAGDRFAEPEESLDGMHGKSSTNLRKSETGDLGGNAADQESVAACDVKKLRHELMKEVTGMVDELQSETMRHINDLRFFCSKEFVLLENLIDAKCRELQNTFRKERIGENEKRKCLRNKSGQSEGKPGMEQECSSKIQIDHLFKSF